MALLPVFVAFVLFAEPVLSDQAEPAAQVKEVQVLIPPIMEPGKSAWISVYEEGTFALGDYPVLINGVEHHTDTYGVLSFTVPDELKISLPRKAGGDSEMTFTKTGAGLLVCEAKLAPVCDGLQEIAGSRKTPVLLYAPASIDKLSPFMVFGRNFSGKFDQDRLKIDGLEADLFAGSSVCLLARGREQMPLGALREMCVFANQYCSESHEVDICRLQITQQGDASALVSLVGSNMPALVEISNRDPAAADLQFKTKKLGTTSTLVLPGGDSNRVQIGFVSHGAGKAQFETRFLCDPLLSLAWREKSMEDGNVKEVCKLLHLHQAARLKRRLLSVDNRLSDAIKRREQPSLDSQEAEQLLAESRALALRKEHLLSALAAQRILVAAEGAGDEEFDRAVDAATGGVAFSLEKSLSQLDLAGEAALARTDARRKKQQVQSQEALLSSFVMPAMQVPPPAKWHRLPKLPPRYRNLIPPPPPYLPSVSQLGPMVFIQQDLSAAKHPGNYAAPSKKTSADARHKSSVTGRSALLSVSQNKRATSSSKRRRK